MVYRIDEWAETGINPITNQAYDPSWTILALTDDSDYQKMCGSCSGSAYTIKVSRCRCGHWEMAVGDFIAFSRANGKNAILVMAETDFEAAKTSYQGHSYNDGFLRQYEPPVLIHSTPMDSWEQIRRDGMLKSWNRLKADKAITEKQPIGKQLGDPEDFSDYIMFGSGVTGEIVVNSKQQGKIVMDPNGEYLTGARLYFDAKKMAEDGLLIRDGCHMKVKDALPLAPYLLWAATWDVIGLIGQCSTPKIFADRADRQFQLMGYKIS